MRKPFVSSFALLAALNASALALLPGCSRADDPAPASAPNSARLTGVQATASQPFRNVSLPLETRVANLMSLLTQDEKLSLLGGTGFTTQPIDRLGIPPMSMCDAGQGVRGGTQGMQGPATLFPSGVAMASTWDTALIGQVGQAIGDELKNKGEGAQVLLGPDINIQRAPLSGRYGECFTEDPYLNGRLVVSYVTGVQSNGVAACAKHFVCNNEEVDRNTADVHVDERALREIYLAGFKAAVTQGHAWTVMPSYNLINGYHATDNKMLLTDVARGDWHFDGLMISDWGAVHDTVQAANAGNDLEMPTGANFSPAKLQAALQAEQITQAQIDTLVTPIVRTIIRVGLVNGTGTPQTPNHAEVNSPAHQQLALQASEEGLVLLKNQGGVLPLDLSKIHSVAVIGPGATKIQGGAAGSPAVTPFFQSEPLDALKARLGKAGITVNYASGATLPDFQPTTIDQTYLQAGSNQPGVTAAYYQGKDFTGNPIFSYTLSDVDSTQSGPTTGAPVGFDDLTQHAARYTATLTPPSTGSYKLEFVTDYRPAQVYLDGKLVLDTVANPPIWSGQNATRADITLTGGQKYALRVDVPGGGGAPFHLGWIVPPAMDFAGAATAAKNSDVAIVFASTSGTEIEGIDRTSMDLPGNQDALIQAVVAANKKTIVVLNNGGPVNMTQWLAQVPALIEAHFPGEQAGNAIAAALVGDVNPSGKLPDTLAARREDYPDYGNYPAGANNVENYAEGIYVGYRHFDKAGIKPLFPFGYGLSYTTFKYSGINMTGTPSKLGAAMMVSVNITNTGKRAGAEVAELYVRDMEPKEDRPIRELKGFQRVMLEPGQTKTVSFPLTPHDMSYFNAQTRLWTTDPGQYNIQIGASSRDIRQTAKIERTGTYTAKP